MRRRPACGRTNVRIKGWMGRADQTTKVRAMFVHPAQVVNITRRHPDILKARLVVSGRMANDVMTLHCEVAQAAGAGPDDAPAADMAYVLNDADIAFAWWKTRSRWTSCSNWPNCARKSRHIAYEDERGMRHYGSRVIALARLQELGRAWDQANPGSFDAAVEAG